MACFLVSAAEAVVAAVSAKSAKTHEEQHKAVAVEINGKTTECGEKIPFSRKLKWLSNMLWGGTALLAFEHIWHGEVQPWFPFLTAAGSPESLAEMLHEVATAGVGMALLVTAVWLGMVAVTSVMEKKFRNRKQ